jgi:hypothetical protein
MVLATLHKGMVMKIVKVVILGLMLALVSQVSLAKGPGNKGPGQGNKSSQGTAGQGSGGQGSTNGQGNKAGQTTDKGQANSDKVKPENAEAKREQTRDATSDQTGTKNQDRDRIHTPGTGTTVPAAVPVTN